MSKLTTYRVSYRIVQTYHIDVDASTSEHAAAWTQTLLDRFGTALQGSKSLSLACHILDAQLPRTLSRISLPIA
jgi:hypothetical protein